MVVLTNQRAVFAFHPRRRATIRTIRSGSIEKTISNQKILSLTHSLSSSTQLGYVMDGAGDIHSLSTSTLDVALGLLSTDNIKVAFSVATFFPQIFWLFLILIVRMIDFSLRMRIPL
jgi:hypothetical protein